jgi:hypothetical protein
MVVIRQGEPPIDNRFSLVEPQCSDPHVCAEPQQVSVVLGYKRHVSALSSSPIQGLDNIRVSAQFLLVVEIKGGQKVAVKRRNPGIDTSFLITYRIRVEQRFMSRPNSVLY